MRFRNYRNRFNRTNRIYSDEDIRNMKLAAIFDNENDILAQNHEIGIPTLKELQNSQNTRWIKSFVDRNGKQDGGYWQSISDDEEEYEDNYDNQDEQGSIVTDDEKQDILLEGGVEYNFDTRPIVSQIDRELSKYSELNPLAAIQKAATKIPVWHSSEKEYYEHALKLADGEEPTDFMKKNNDFRKISDISDPDLKQMYLEKAAKMYNWDLSNPAVYDSLINTDIVIPKENSQLHSQIKNSETFQRWVAENYENIKNNNNTNSYIEFPKSMDNDNAQRSLFATIHNADLKNFKINEDGSMSGELLDGYDFDEMKEKANFLKSMALKTLNNNAYAQQEAGKLQKYLISNQIHLTKEELEEILRKYGYIK